MKQSQFRRIIKEEVRKTLNEGRALSSDHKSQLDGLVEETIYPALLEDMELSTSQFSLAIKYIVDQLQKLKPF